MTTLDRLRTLRTHLLANWKTALDWINSSYDRNHTPCLLILRTPDNRYVVGTDDSQERIELLTALGITGFLFTLRMLGREGLLMRLDRAIAVLEEHEVPTGEEGMEISAKVSKTKHLIADTIENLDG